MVRQPRACILVPTQTPRVRFGELTLSDGIHSFPFKDSGGEKKRKNVWLYVRCESFKGRERERKKKTKRVLLRGIYPYPTLPLPEGGLKLFL